MRALVGAFVAGAVGTSLLCVGLGLLALFIQVTFIGGSLFGVVLLPVAGGVLFTAFPLSVRLYEWID